jgi:molecular chaperone GrpE
MNSTADDDPMSRTGNGSPADQADGEGALRAQLAELQAQADRHRDDYLRVVAEMDNLRKRTAREIESAQRFAVEKFAGDLLEVRDSLELGIAAAAAGGDPVRLQEGMQATLRLIDKAFERAGLTVLDPQGQPFNPERHEAMATQESPEQAPGTIVAVVQKGYLLNGRVVRPARVLIARAPAN